MLNLSPKSLQTRNKPAALRKQSALLAAKVALNNESSGDIKREWNRMVNDFISREKENDW